MMTSIFKLFSMSFSRCCSSSSADSKLQDFARKLEQAKQVIVMCGAGLSTSANIPDFRSPGTGLYSQLQDLGLPYPEAIFELSYFKSHPQAFQAFAKDLWPGRQYEPTLGHHFIRLLHDKGKLLRCYTQNIDSLESLAGVPKDKIVAAHGNFDSATCVFTGIHVPMDDVREAYMNGTHEELNAKHGTKLVKPDIVFFGEALPERFFELKKKDFSKCDLLIVLGTSLQVQPFASLIEEVKQGTPRLLINRERVGEYPSGGFNFTGTDSCDVLYLGNCDDGCLEISKLLKWDTNLQVKRNKAKL